MKRYKILEGLGIVLKGLRFPEFRKWKRSLVTTEDNCIVLNVQFFSGFL